MMEAVDNDPNETKTAAAEMMTQLQDLLKAQETALKQRRGFREAIQTLSRTISQSWQGFGCVTTQCGWLHQGGRTSTHRHAI